LCFFTDQFQEVSGEVASEILFGALNELWIEIKAYFGKKKKKSFFCTPPPPSTKATENLIAQPDNRVQGKCQDFPAPLTSQIVSSLRCHWLQVASLF
jgi:hypothetical protein